MGPKYAHALEGVPNCITFRQIRAALEKRFNLRNKVSCHKVILISAQIHFLYPPWAQRPTKRGYPCIDTFHGLIGRETSPCCTFLCLISTWILTCTRRGLLIHWSLPWRSIGAPAHCSQSLQFAIDVGLRQLWKTMRVGNRSQIGNQISHKLDLEIQSSLELKSMSKWKVRMRNRCGMKKTKTNK